MSNLYEVTVEIGDHALKKRDKIIAYLKRLPFFKKDKGYIVAGLPSSYLSRVITAKGKGVLRNELEEEFATRVTHKIWDINEAFCYVTITTVYLEDPPTEEFVYNETDYHQYKEIPIK